VSDITIIHTNRGFVCANFRDAYGEPSSLQESSAALVPHIWLGRDQMRMHLNQEQVAELLPLLHTFVETGKLESEQATIIVCPGKASKHQWIYADDSPNSVWWYCSTCQQRWLEWPGNPHPPSDSQSG
jgi:hypothetical protein